MQKKLLTRAIRCCKCREMMQVGEEFTWGEARIYSSGKVTIAPKIVYRPCHTTPCVKEQADKLDAKRELENLYNTLKMTEELSIPMPREVREILESKIVDAERRAGKMQKNS